MCVRPHLPRAEKWGPQRKVSVVDMASLVFRGFLHLPPAWKVFSLRPEKVSKKEFLSVVVVYAFFFSVKHLVAQSSATGVTVAAIPPCGAIRFRNPKVPWYPPPARRAPCMLRMRGKCDSGVRKRVRHLDLGGCSAILARHLWFCGNLMRHSMRDTV